MSDDRSSNAFEPGKPGTQARDQAEAAIETLRKKGGIFVEAVRATRMPMALTDPNLPGNPIIFANEAFLKLSGYSMADVLGQQPHFMNGVGTNSSDAARFKEAIRADQDDLIETVQYRKNGSRFIATVLVSAFKDDEGRTLNHFMSWLDVTRRAEAEDEVAELKRVQAALHESERRANLLLAELQHRVRNTLAVVRSIARRTAESSSSAEDLLAHFQARLDAFARVQTAVTRSLDGTVDLMSLIEDELVAHAARGRKIIRVAGPDVALEAKAAERMSLAIHELTTNAVKHGALVNGRGRIEIRWKKDRTNGSDRLLLKWTESGMELENPALEREGFGMELLRQSLPYDLQAETRVELRRSGLRFELNMPLAQAAT